MSDIEELEPGTGDVDKTAEIQARLDAAEKARQEAELARARAEGEAHALKTAPRAQDNSNAPVPQLTEEQWQQAEREYGVDRTQIQANAKLFGTLSAPLQKAARDAEERARKAEEKLENVEKRRQSEKSLSRIEEKFYAENPTLTGHRGEVDSFLAKFSEDDKNDPKKYAELLADAKIYVRGKVKDERDNRRRTSSRDIDVKNDKGDDADDRNDQDDEIRLEGFSESEKSIISRLVRDPGNLSEKLEDERKELLSTFKSSQGHDGYGVEIDSSDEFKRGSALRRGLASRNTNKALD